jgi:hypothetical protein
MTAQHTPGPWISIDNLIGNEDCEIATLWYPEYSPNKHRERRANAKLIAAAPDLLEALQLLMAQTNSNELAVALDKARAAIAKATGSAV